MLSRISSRWSEGADGEEGSSSPGSVRAHAEQHTRTEAWYVHLSFANPIPADPRLHGDELTKLGSFFLVFCLSGILFFWSLFAFCERFVNAPRDTSPRPHPRVAPGPAQRWKRPGHPRLARATP